MPHRLVLKPLAAIVVVVLNVYLLPNLTWIGICDVIIYFYVKRPIIVCLIRNRSLFLFLNSTLAISSESDIYKKIDLFGEVLEKINEEYVEDINQSESMDSAINGLLQSLDPYSAYLSPENFEEMQTETSGEFGGLGIEVSMEAGVVKVITPLDDTPASRAGLKAGDYIVKINDTQVQGKTLTEAVEIMRGPVGSDIELTVRRRGVKKALTFTLTREIIEIQSVKSDLLDKNIGYLRLTSFNENSAQQIKKRINDLNNEKNLKDLY